MARLPAVPAGRRRTTSTSRRAICRPPRATLIGGDWYDALQLPDGQTLLSVGDLTGHGVTATSGMAMLLGALRGMAVAGTRPGR